MTFASFYLENTHTHTQNLITNTSPASFVPFCLLKHPKELQTPPAGTMKAKGITPLIEEKGVGSFYFFLFFYFIPFNII